MAMSLLSKEQQGIDSIDWSGDNKGTVVKQVSINTAQMVNLICLHEVNA